MKLFREYLETENVHNQLFTSANPCQITDSRGYSAKILCDSVNAFGSKNSRLTTIVCTYPRIVHSELMTHRMFSRNAASSRAIPVNKQIKMINANYAVPYKLQKNQKGMQGGEELDEKSKFHTLCKWINAKNSAIDHVEEMLAYDPHKQICNRILEPFMWMTTIISSTNWNNFFAQRCTDKADPTLRHIAELIRYVVENNKPEPIGVEFDSVYKWHLPFIYHSPDRDELIASYKIDDLRKIATARCARVSYMNHEGKYSPEDDLRLFHDNLLNGNHYSPFEHIAKAGEHKLEEGFGGNFGRGWCQFRKMFNQECIY